MRYMSQPLSLRLPEATVRQLGAHASRRRLAVEEGLRMEDHPLVRFVDGVAGRRARLVGTAMDVWQVIAIVRANNGDARAAAVYLEVPLGLVQAAVTYYGAYADEIDEWIELNRRESEQAHTAWLAGQAALQR